jgi:predicted nucleic acid-binding protein
LGLVLDARKRHVITSARDTLLRLRECAMYLSDRIVDAALREIDE